MTTNHASSGYTPMQVGQVLGPSRDTDTEPADRTPPATVEVRHERRGNATVGGQYDTVHIIGGGPL